MATVLRTAGQSISIGKKRVTIRLIQKSCVEFFLEDSTAFELMAGEKVWISAVRISYRWVQPQLISLKCISPLCIPVGESELVCI